MSSQLKKQDNDDNEGNWLQSSHQHKDKESEPTNQEK